MRVPRAGFVNRGFSLIEVLIAVVVLSLGLLALASLQSALIRSASDAKSQSLAMAVAKQKIEQLAAVHALGGADAGCVSPTIWAAGGPPSCYREIDSEPRTDFDGDPATDAAIEPLGGVEFEVGTTVTRFVYDVSTQMYKTAANQALDSALTTTPETLVPGKEFKRIVVSVFWTGPTGVEEVVQVEDVLNGIVPRDSIALLSNQKSIKSRNAEAIIFDPGKVDGVIPIAIGTSNTAASNPTPELLGSKDATYVSETRFEVHTYKPLGDDRALAQSRVETSVVACRCDTSAASAAQAPLRPTYWDGLSYVIPSEANYVGLKNDGDKHNLPPAGPKAVTGQELAQSGQCTACCRDHHDPAGTDSNGDPWAAVAKFSPRRSSHTHFKVDEATGVLSSGSGVYSEVCRMVRVNGFFRVAADLHNDYFALLPASNDGEAPFAPSPDVSANYADMVKKYIGARITTQSSSSLYNGSPNSTAPAGPSPATYEAGSRVVGGTSVAYDLNDPAKYYLKLSNDSKWLHARGLYVDFLTPEAIARLDLAKSECPTQPATDDCVLPYLPFTSINLSELAEWDDVPVNPTGTASGQIISVMNHGLRTSTGGQAYVVPDASGSAGSTTISFTALPDKIVIGMTASGLGVAAGARVVDIPNGEQTPRVTLDLANSGVVSGAVTFQGSPVRGQVVPGTLSSLASGYSSNARAKATYNNAGLALKFPMNAEDKLLADSELFEINANGGEPDPTAGNFTVTGFAGYLPLGTRNPIVQWGIGPSGTFSIVTCTRQGAPTPYLCSPTSGLGGQMRIRLSGYNYFEGDKSETYTGQCKKPNGTFVTVTTTTPRPYCRNYDVTTAATATISASEPYLVSGDGKESETTDIKFTLLDKDDVITIEMEDKGSIGGAFLSCSVGGNGNITVAWSPCI